MYSYSIFILVVSLPGLGYAAIHRRYLHRDFGYRLFPPFVLWQAVVFFAVEVIALHAGWWGVRPEKTLGIGIFGVPIEELLFFVCIPQATLLIWALSRRPGSWRRACYLAGHHIRQWRER